VEDTTLRDAALGACELHPHIREMKILITQQ